MEDCYRCPTPVFLQYKSYYLSFGLNSLGFRFALAKLAAEVVVEDGIIRLTAFRHAYHGDGEEVEQAVQRAVALLVALVPAFASGAEPLWGDSGKARQLVRIRKAADIADFGNDASKQ
jgi:hypothetical protein